MRGAIGMAFFWLMSMSIMVFVPDLIVYGTLVYKANAAVEQATKEAEMRGGFTPEVEAHYKKVLHDYGLEMEGARGHPSTVPYRDKIMIGYQGTYTFRAFNLFGTGVGTFTLPIVAQDVGVNEVWNHGKKLDTYTALIHDPNHPKRALEAPNSTYCNNESKQKWVQEIKANDLMAIDIKLNPSTVTEEKRTYIKASVKNRGLTLEKNVEISYFANGKKIKSIRKDLPANRTITLPSVAYQPQTTGVQAIRVEVDPNREKEDHDRTNNIATTGFTVTTDNGKQHTPEGCQQPVKKASWLEAYQVITGKHSDQIARCWFEKGGVWPLNTTYFENVQPMLEKYDCDDIIFNRYDYEIYKHSYITYYESLKIDAKINTKQGSKTDPDHSKESDQESRGSWEIINYAKKQGIDPNTVTRAGDGMELKVTTTYETDWEKKVPDGAKPIGTKYSGILRYVTASIVNQKGRVVDEIQLEKTSDNGKVATWEFPIVKYRHPVTGKTYSYRKYYTDKDWADGKRSIYIKTSGVGATQINQCKYVDFMIYGSMYDDS